MKIKREEEYYWQRLDNAAKIFPAISNRFSPSVFRLTVKLTSAVDGDILQRATEQALKDMPSFNVKLRRGLFWYYFEKNFAVPVVKEDNAFPCRRIDKFSDNGFLFRVLYFEKKINLEVFHVLTDGTGASHFLRHLVYLYLQEAFPQEQFEEETPSRPADSPLALDEDSFQKYQRLGDEAEKPPFSSAYHVEGVRVFGAEMKVVQGIFSASQMVALAKSKGVTVTAYFTALLLESIYQESYRYHEKKQRVSVCIPVNLRNFYKTDTMRNFFSTIGVAADFYNKEHTFDELLELASHQLQEELSAKMLADKIRYNVQAEKNLALRFVPLFFKNLGLKLIYQKGEKAHSITLSNLGRMTFPKEIAAHIDRYEFLLSTTKSQGLKTTAVSTGDVMVYTFTSNLEEMQVAKRFFRMLVAEGIPVTIASNEREEKADENL
ncbi:MAG: hypothetical protein PHD67_08560 [Oscillospiraceae bacterium]|nr:hypothetical protein [Oscillospiraceae bacterium]